MSRSDVDAFLTRLDATVTECGTCGRALSADGPSLYYCNENCAPGDSGFDVEAFRAAAVRVAESLIEARDTHARIGWGIPVVPTRAARAAALAEYRVQSEERLPVRPRDTYTMYQPEAAGPIPAPSGYETVQVRLVEPRSEAEEQMLFQRNIQTVEITDGSFRICTVITLNRLREDPDWRQSLIREFVQARDVAASQRGAGRRDR